MACLEYSHDLQRYMDEELSGPDLDRVLHHLRSCSDCAEHLRDIQRVEASLAKVEWLELTGDFTAHVLNSVEWRARSRLRWSWMKVGVPAAVVVVAFVAGTALSDAGQTMMVGPSRMADNVVIQHGEVVVPRNTTIKGPLTVKNGDVRVYGHVHGDVTTLNGRIIMASGADITGEKLEVNAIYQWIAYYATNLWHLLKR